MFIFNAGLLLNLFEVLRQSHLAGGFINVQFLKEPQNEETFLTGSSHLNFTKIIIRSIIYEISGLEVSCHIPWQKM